jgi:hypothetical protein
MWEGICEWMVDGWMDGWMDGSMDGRREVHGWALWIVIAMIMRVFFNCREWEGRAVAYASK